MGPKGLATENRILKTAEELFARYGFVAVTMKDISLATPISRGGLYRHFPSTAGIFSEIIRREQERAKAALEKAKAGEVCPDKILGVYLTHRMTSISESDFGIDNAITEFAANSDEGKALAVSRAEDCISIISELIAIGNDTGIFKCESPVNAAKNISWMIEGMCKHSALIPVTQDDIDSQMDIIFSLLGADK